MFVFALLLLFFANHHRRPCCSIPRIPPAWRKGTTSRCSLSACSWRCSSCSASTPPGTFGEETLDASRQAPRGVLSSIWLSGIVGAIFLLAVILSFKDIPASIAEGQAFGFPIATTIKDNLTYDHR